MLVNKYGLKICFLNRSHCTYFGIFPTKYHKITNLTLVCMDCFCSHVLPERREEHILPIVAVYNMVVQTEGEVAVSSGQLPHSTG